MSCDVLFSMLRACYHKIKMTALSFLLLYSLSVLVLVFPGSNGQTDCKFNQTTPCQCTVDGKTIDISNYFSYPTDPKPDQDDRTYQYSCTEMDCETDKSKKGVACQLSGGTTYVLGRVTSNMEWKVHKLDPLNFSIHYGDGDGGSKKRVTNVNFAYDNSEMTSEVTSSQSSIYNIVVTGSRVKTGGGGGGGNPKSSGGGNKAGPVGIVIIVLALAAFITYFIVGGIYMYRVKGARGMEVVPHYAFWKDLPFLIKDGFFFTISPCYKRSKAYENL